MDKKTMQDIAVIVTTLAEVDGSPESMLYLAIGADLEYWNTIKYALVSTDLIHEEYNFVTITDKGRALADKINSAMKVSA